MNPHVQYLRYVLRHKWYVFQECCKYGLYLRGVVHDWHKFLPIEWFPYVDHFYREWPAWDEVGTYHRHNIGHRYTKEWAQERFDRAWLHHQHKAPHHWQHWVLRQDDGSVKCLPMPWEYRAEMVADWRGAGRAIKGRDETHEWYLDNRHKMLLHPDTRLWVEMQLGVITLEEVNARQFTLLKDEPLYPSEWGTA